jgi:hypothetical protein
MPRVAPVDAMMSMATARRPAAWSMPTAPVPNAGLDLEDRNLNQALDAALRLPRTSGCDRPCHRPAARRRQRHRASGRWRQHQGALVVGADGAQSWVRGQCDIGLDYRSYGNAPWSPILNANCRTTARPTSGSRAPKASWPCCRCRQSGVAGVVGAGSAGRHAACRIGAADRRPPAVYAHEKLGALTPLQPELVRDFPLRLMRPHKMTSARVA